MIEHTFAYIHCPMMDRISMTLCITKQAESVASLANEKGLIIRQTFVEVSDFGQARLAREMMFAKMEAEDVKAVIVEHLSSLFVNQCDSDRAYVFDKVRNDCIRLVGTDDIDSAVAAAARSLPKQPVVVSRLEAQ